MANKIFDKEVERFLLDAGVTLQEVNRIKFNKGKEGVLQILEEIIEHIKCDSFDRVAMYTKHSPDGDGYGLDNKVIDFTKVFYIEEPDYIVDIIGACDALKALKQEIF